MLPLLQPSLYSAQGTLTLPDGPALRSVVSRAGHISFPPQSQGCQVSGQHGDDLMEMLLTGRGRLNAIATVHVHAKPVPKTPFTVVEILMEDGPLVCGLLSASASATLQPGTTIEEVIDAQGARARDLHFRAEDTQAAAKEATHGK